MQPPVPPAIPVAYAAVDSSPVDAPVQLRGDPEQPGDAVPRRWLSIFGGERVGLDGGSGRREFADRIVQHPLFARVMVNRIWQNHFGRGLVATPNDFGTRGDPPTHPELLDWLAVQFRANGYRVKPLHRLIMLSAAYQRASSVPEELLSDMPKHDAIASAAPAAADPENLWLSHFSPRRLTAEEIRDTLLTASGQLDHSFAEAHPFPPAAEWAYTQHTPFNAVYETDRRSVFLMVQRQRRHPYLALFDGADPNSSTASRQVTTVPTQALYFLNDPFFHTQAAAFASRTSGDEQIENAFRVLFQRAASDLEVQVAERFLGNYPGTPSEKWSAFARVLMASNEFLYLD